MPLRLFRRNMSPTLTAGLETLKPTLHTDATREFYNSCVRSLIDTIGDLPLTDVTVDHIRRWSKSLDNAEYSKASLNTYRRGVRAFFNHMVDLQLIPADDNPVSNFKFPASPAPEPKHLQPHDVEKILQHSRHDTRNYAILRIMYDTGCRLSDLVSMTIENVMLRSTPATKHLKGNERALAEIAEEMGLLHMLSDEFTARHEGKILVLGKGQRGIRRHRWVYFGHETALALREYIDTRPLNAPAALWLTSTGKPLKHSSFYWVFKRAAEAAGVDASPHDMRHTFAFRLLRNGADAKMVQSLLGHTDIQTTLNYYYNFSDDELWEVHRQFSSDSEHDTDQNP